jgi:hypothetical protein
MKLKAFLAIFIIESILAEDLCLISYSIKKAIFRPEEKTLGILLKLNSNCF